MPKRVQSPSSINTYRQCPRKYYYQYIMKLPTKPSIYLVRGSIVHEVLESFFTLRIELFEKGNHREGFMSFVSSCLARSWKHSKKSLDSLHILPGEMEHYFIESHEMLRNFVDGFCSKLERKMAEGKELANAFMELSPRVEEEIIDEGLSVKGFIDAVHDSPGSVVIMDYKTSNKMDITGEYRLQLAIYALLYMNKYGRMPDKVGINFLRFGELLLDVDKSLLSYAKSEIMLIHERTLSGEIADYPRKVSALCKWSNGQCDFFETCRPF
ncbi:PD-(D/E)XK nuclease family protein [Candidatus Woesearchaeota archaeon]|nr:PD-(D/E)XK nuclease family protein [Candidatus Woesearchaeota archaeon]